MAAEEQIAMLARTVLSGDALSARAMALDIHAIELSGITKPGNLSANELCVAAGLVELFAERQNCDPPIWTKSVPPWPEPLFLVKNAERMPRLRELCETGSPDVLRRRNLFVPPNYLTFV